MALALDTLAYARRLREAGFSEQQAEGQAQALAAAMTDTLATKQDLKELEARATLQLTAHGTLLESRLSDQDKWLEMRLAEQDGRLEMRLAEQDRLIETRLAELEKRLDARLSEQEKRIGVALAAQDKLIDTRLAEQDKRMEIRLAEQTAHFETRFSDLERRMTFRLGGIMVAGIGAVSALVKLL